MKTMINRIKTTKKLLKINTSKYAGVMVSPIIFVLIPEAMRLLIGI